jgi:hypothetical protein
MSRIGDHEERRREAERRRVTPPYMFGEQGAAEGFQPPEPEATPEILRGRAKL